MDTPDFAYQFILGALVLTLAVLAGCAAGPNEPAGSADKSGVVAGFWRGWWHGFISPVTFVISLFSSKVRMYEVHNDGGWYNFGYLLGCMAIFGGSAGGGAGARRRRKQGLAPLRPSRARPGYHEHVAAAAPSRGTAQTS